MSNGKTPPPPSQRWLAPVICLGLVVITWAVFGQTARFGFVNFDDSKYVYENPVVRKGLTWEGVRWALSYSEIGHWHPLTWLTHMADCQVYGLWPGGHHITNVALHSVAAVLLFLVLRRMTGFVWRSALLAAVFAVHPLRAESVAWIAERKDVLSGVFFMLTLWAYVNYVRQPSRIRYAMVAGLFALGLLAKNMLVTLPLVLLLLDWWPLGRMRRREAGARNSGIPFWGLVKEKIPLLLLSAGSCVATALVSEKIGQADRVPALARLGNAVVSYVIYMRQMVYPAGLANPYPYPLDGPPLWKVGAALAILATMTALSVGWRRTRPFLLVGWLWYLGMLVPVIGIAQISYYAHADRYTYLPEIGLTVAVVWLLADWAAQWRVPRGVMGGLMAAVLVALMICAGKQTAYWKDSETLCARAVACTQDNYHALFNLAAALASEGKLDEAMVYYQKALDIKPAHAEPYFNLGNILAQNGRVDDAMTQFQKALQIRHDYKEAHVNLGTLLQQKGEVDQAIAHYQLALQASPDYAEAHVSLASVLLRTGQADEAIDHCQSVLRINPGNAAAHFNLGIAFLQKGNEGQALTELQEASRLQPDSPLFLNRVAWILATSQQASLRNGAEAVQLAKRANDLTGGQNPALLATLAAAQAEASQFKDAILTAQKAIALAQSGGQRPLAQQLATQLQRYQGGLPYRN